MLTRKQVFNLKRLGDREETNLHVPKGRLVLEITANHTRQEIAISKVETLQLSTYILLLNLDTEKLLMLS